MITLVSCSCCDGYVIRCVRSEIFHGYVKDEVLISVVKDPFQILRLIMLDRRFTKIYNGPTYLLKDSNLFRVEFLYIKLLYNNKTLHKWKTKDIDSVI